MPSVRLTFVRVVWICLGLLSLGSSSAAAQGFQVKPMQMDLVVQSGRMSETILELSNTTMQNLALDVHVVELSQNSAGAWQLATAGADGVFANPASATSWTFVERSTVSIAPSSTESVAVRFSPPPGASGTYVAGIIAEQPRVPDATGLVVRVRFLIPVIIQIEGRPVRQQVELDDLRLTFLDGADGGQRTSVAHVLISNKGRTYSQLRGEVRILRFSGEDWRPVTRYSIPERGIIPGAKFDLATDLERRLPSGMYRLRGEIAVDGRRSRPLEVDIEFQGDPEVDAVPTIQS